ncbi:MAG TPA: response regulator [Microvirga sp.]|jgi:FixJ family two-component response regulator|nr:response regulator [Microvirga sp.]
MEQMGGTKLAVAVVDDDPAVCDSLATLFRLQGFEVHTFGTAGEFVRALPGFKPDAVLLDVHMPTGSGLDALEAIGGASHPAPIIMISGQGDIPMAVAAIKAGAHDFIEKPFDGGAVIERVRDAVRARAASHANPPKHRHFPKAETLTARELDVLNEIARGLSNKEAGRILGISPRTVEVHRARVMEKLGARNTADLMRIVLSDQGSR